MNLELLWGPTILVTCAAALIALAPAAIRTARAAYAEAVEDPRSLVRPSRQPDPAPRRIFIPDDPVWPIRPAA